MSDQRVKLKEGTEAFYKYGNKVTYYVRSTDDNVAYLGYFLNGYRHTIKVNVDEIEGTL